MVIDGNKLILGRVAAAAAKKSLEGEQVIIVNCEKMIITGNPKRILQKFKERQDKGGPYTGPFFPKMPDRVVRRTIRGMLPYKKWRGKTAYKRVKCFIGIPKEYKTQKFETVNNADASKLTTLKFITVGDLSRFYNKKF